ncbi:tetratricopeptide repeat protein [Nocardia amamiensis]|uniref:tetratricopeptide repeat protein n=1 Tax=Nocardia amamiensis TaxID=404578 RepID=UPI00082A0437|nr:tetratricopeptide repeat protein [Nocardia amamiensis]
MSGPREQFFAKLDALRQAARSPSVQVISREANVPEGTLRSWFPKDKTKRRTVPRIEAQLEQVLVFLLRRAGRLPERAVLDRRTREEWSQLRRAATESADIDIDTDSRPAWAGLVEQLADDGELPHADQLDPYQLGATPTRFGQWGNSGTGQDEYVPRTARDVDKRVAAGLASHRMVVVTGPSKAGKTRTLFEALRRELPQARVIVPARGALHRVPDHPEFVASTEPVVIWLENLQDFLTTDHPITPALLTHLAARPARTVVAATLRSEALELLRRDTGELTHDTRTVLEQAFQVELFPTSLDPVEHAAAAAAYPSLNLDRYGLAEVLAGAPELLRRYDTARNTDPILRAVLEVAIDWTRIGRPDPIPEAILGTLALTSIEDQRADLDVDPAAVHTAIAVARAPSMEVGRVAALSVERLSDRSRAYRPFDYLVAADDGQDHPPRPVTDDFWHSATEDAEPRVLRAVGFTAYLRGRPTEAETLWRNSADGGDSEAMHNLGVLLSGRGDIGEAEIWWRRAADAGDLDAIYNLGLLLSGRGDTEEAEVWWRRAADAGSTRAIYSLGLLLSGRGDTEEAETWWRHAAVAGYPVSMNNLATLLYERSDTSEAEIWWRRAADAGDLDAMYNLGLLLRERGDIGEAEIWWRRGADTGDPEAMNNLGTLLRERGDTEEAEARWRHAAATGHVGAMYNLGLLLASRGDTGEAETWYRRAADAGHLDAMYNLGFLLAGRGDTGEAETWYRRAASAGDLDSMHNLALLLRERGRTGEAEAWLRRAADAGHMRAMFKLQLLLRERGDTGEAET